MSTLKFISSGLFYLDLPISPPFRMVHWCVAWSWTKRRNNCFRNAYFYHPVLSQVWSSNYYAGRFHIIFSTSFPFIVTLILQYICENHFQRLSKRSLFTGLKASNHFGRPDMSAFLRFVQKKHSYVWHMLFIIVLGNILI